jgi:predicted metal-dependent peptidase
MLTVYVADAAAHRLAGPPRRQVKLTGGGGTDMAAAIATALAARPAPDLVVVITDGLTPWPAARPSRDVIVALLPTAVTRPAPPSWAHVVEIVTGDRRP